MSDQTIEPPKLTPIPKETALLNLIDDLPKYRHTSSEWRVHLMTAVVDHLRGGMAADKAKAHAGKHATGDLAVFLKCTSLSEFRRRFYHGPPGRGLSEVIEEIREAPAAEEPGWSPPNGLPSPEEWREIVNRRLAVADVLEAARTAALAGEDGEES